LFENKKCISFGCGTGELEILLGRNNYSITEVDISDYTMKIANKHKKKGENQKCEILQFE